MQPKHKACPRCGALFECRMHDPQQCQCADIELSERLIELLRTEWHDCLCAYCLRELADRDSSAAR